MRNEQFTDDEADISIVSHVLTEAANGKKAIWVLSDDIDIFYKLIYWVYKSQLECQVQMEKWNSTVLSINKTCKALGDRCLEILGVHFLSGSDTTSYPFGKGKQTVLNIAKRFSFPEFDSVLGDLNATDMQLQQLGRKFFCALYQQSNEKVCQRSGMTCT